MCDSETVEMEPRINSGFYLMRSTPKTVHLFAEERVASIYTLQSEEKRIIGDQNYIKSNIVQDKIPYSILPLRLFPNGAFWMANADAIQEEAYIVHFTHIKGQEKRTRMAEHGMWFGEETTKMEL
jgi:hypothetical protein